MTDGDLLGYDRVGSGARRVVVLNDWMCDTSTWDGARVYLDGERFSWAFADLRGYGRSRALRGAYTASEAANDVIALADALGWDRFSVVGHSMSTLVALHLAQHRADRVERAVLITPPPPGGFGASDDVIEGGRALARSDDAARAELLAKQLGDRLTKRWAAHKAARWSATAAPEAAAGYVMMFMRDGVPDLNARVAIPLLAITGEQDAPPMRGDAVEQNLSPLCDQLEVTRLADSGHYPMQEVPPLTVTLVERFLAAESA